MKQIMKRETIKEYILRLGINFGTLLIFWGGMLRKSFTSDTISHMVASDADVQVNMEQGRYLKALVDGLLLKYGLRTTTNISVTMLLAFIFLALTMLLLQITFQRWEPQKLSNRIAFNLILNLWVCNVLFVENLMFSEVSIYFALAYFLAAIGVFCYTKKRYVWMIIMLAVSTLAYQYAVVFAAIFVAFYIFLEERKLTWKVFWREILGITICMGMGVLNLISIWILIKSDTISQFFKSAGVGDMKLKISQMLQSFLQLHKDAAGILPSLWLPLLIMLVVAVLIILSSIQKKQLSELVFFGIVIIGSCMLLYVIPLTEEHFYFPPRMSFCFFAIQGVIMAAAYTLISSEKAKILNICCICYLMLHLLFADFVVTNHFVSNTLDRVYVQMAYQEILKYEEEMDTTVTNLCVCNDINAPAYYSEVHYVSDQINERSLGILSVSIMEVVTGRKFQKVEMNQEVYDTYFAGKNWDYFDLSEQMVIIGDTAYWCVF